MLEIGDCGSCWDNLVVSGVMFFLVFIKFEVWNGDSFWLNFKFNFCRIFCEFVKYVLVIFGYIMVNMEMYLCKVLFFF